MSPAFEPGQAAQARRRFSAEDVAEYTALSGHEAPDGLVPEPLIGALFSHLLGMKLPGVGTNYLKQQSEFLRSARIGEWLTARVEITRVRPDKQLVDLKTTCRDANGTLTCRGRALVYVGDVKD